MDILILIVFLILYAVNITFSFIFHYYYRILVPGRESYKREELVNIKGILKEEFDLIFQGKEKSFELIAVAAGSILGFILTYFGGIYGEHYESYFFHSIILPLLVYAGLGFVIKNDIAKDLPTAVKLIFKYDFSIFIGFSLATLSKIMLVYGIYHVISFVWVILNVAALFVLNVIRIVEKINKDDYKLVFRR